MSALSLGLLAALMWGFHDICVRFVSQRVPLMATLLTVLSVGLVAHLGLMAVVDGFEALPPSLVGLSALTGVFFLIASLGLYAAFQRGPVRLVSPIIASYPILSVVWAVLNGVPVSLLQWGAVVCIVLGVSLVAILSGDGDSKASGTGKTVFYAVLSAAGFAGTFAMGQAAAAQASEMSVTLIARLVAILILFGAMWALKLPFWPGRRALPVLALMGIADAIALLCVLSAGQLPNAQFAAVASSTFGVLTIVLAWIFLKEPMTLAQWCGVALVFCAIAYLAV